MEVCQRENFNYIILNYMTFITRVLSGRKGTLFEQKQTKQCRGSPTEQAGETQGRTGKAEAKTKILIFSTVAAVIIIFVALIMLIPKANSDFNYSEMHRLGKEDAPVKIVEFGDYKCPACSDFSVPSNLSLLKNT